jgi:hypothetical protein
MNQATHSGMYTKYQLNQALMWTAEGLYSFLCSIVTLNHEPGVPTLLIVEAQFPKPNVILNFNLGAPYLLIIGAQFLSGT